MKISIIIPTFNEGKTLPQIIDMSLKNLKYEIELIVVDDCSTDNTRDILSKSYSKSDKIKIIYNLKNMGKGFCVRKGIEYSSGNIILIQDADLEYNPKDYLKLTKPLIENKINVVYGSRVLGQKRYKNKNFTSLIRIFFNHFLTILSNVINNQKLTDAHTCYKLCRASIFKKITLVENDFAFCPEFTSKISKLNEKILEIPIHYQGRTYDEGKKIKTSDGLKAIIALIKYGLLNK